MSEKKKKTHAEDNEMGCSSLFLDSGAFTMRQLSAKFEMETGRPWKEFYDTDEFWDYANRYAAFVKEHRKGIDLYANIDAIPDPELSWRNQQYLESLGIKPVPVIHLGTGMKWLRHYIDLGYPLIGLGGLIAKGGFGTNGAAHKWLSECFSVICDTKDRLPIVRTHGFGLAGPLAFHFPFWSVDSTRWVMPGSFGAIVVPQRRKGEFVFDEEPHVLYICDESPLIGKGKGRHFVNLSRAEQQTVLDWLAFIGLEMGEGPTKDPITLGVKNARRLRIMETLLYYEHLRKHIPKYPWPYRPTHTRRTLGLR